MVTATTASASSTSRAPSMIYLLLALMLGSTALIDIFWWAPFFAILSGIDGQDCSGGFFSGRPYVCTPNHAKGYGRLLVCRESMCLALFCYYSVRVPYTLLILCFFASSLLCREGNVAIPFWRHDLSEFSYSILVRIQ